MIEFIQVLKKNPSVMFAIIGWELKEVKCEKINMENIKQFINNNIFMSVIVFFYKIVIIL